MSGTDVWHLDSMDFPATEHQHARRHPAITARDVCKRYGHKEALKGVSLHAEAGEIIGFIGPNGSGKTTFLQIVAGLVKADSGVLRTYTRTGNQPRVGLMLEKQGLIPHLSSYRNLELLAAISGQADREQIETRLRQVGLDPSDHRRVRTWSQGMRQRLSLAQALLDDPDILLLDEPTNGLDPVGVADLRRILSDVSSRGVTVLLASHALTEVEKLCSRAYFVRNGAVVEEFEIQHGAGLHVRLESLENFDAISRWANESGVTIRNTPGAPSPDIFLSTNMAPADIIIGLVRCGARIVSVTTSSQGLEQRFLQLVQGAS